MAQPKHLMARRPYSTLRQSVLRLQYGPAIDGLTSNPISAINLQIVIPQSFTREIFLIANFHFAKPETI
jgi:hypothetical protein